MTPAWIMRGPSLEGIILILIRIMITKAECILFRRALCWVDRFPGNLWRCILLRCFNFYTVGRTLIRVFLRLYVSL